MTGKERLSVNKNILRAAAAGLAFLLCLLMFAGCSSMNDAEKKVSKELKALQETDALGSEVISLRDSLSDEGKANFDGFLKKLRSFDFVITGSEEGNDKDDDYTLVSVKIKTCDFGREYLAAWTEYLKTNKDIKPDDLTGFYELLFAGLNSIDKKEYIKTIQIVCVDPLGNGEWIANIKENEELQDAIFGGMMSEMKTLAAE
ncbi:MAG: hypothetical protein IJJ06_10750 [Mogibacterium sp.]|nr:hypothetical protein [Mogibacterium sp.]